MAKRKPAKKTKPKVKKKPVKTSKAKAKPKKKAQAKPKPRKKAPVKAKVKAPAKAKAKGRKKKVPPPPLLKGVKTPLIPVILDSAPVEEPTEKPKPTRRRKLKPADVTDIRKLLLKRRGELLTEIQEEIDQSQTGAKQRSADPTDQASDSADGDLALALAQSDTDELQQIEAALTRLLAGELGVCEECECNIPMARLRALPYATTCIDCKRRRELKNTADGLDDAWEALHNSEEEAAKTRD